MAAVAVLGTTVWDTTGGNRTITATPTLLDLIVIVAPATGVATTAVTDNNTDGRGTYTKIGPSFTGFSTGGDLSVWIRNALIRSGTSTIFSVTQASSTGGGMLIYRVTGMSIVGLGAVRGAGGQSSGGSGTTPAPVLLRRVGSTFSGTQAGLTGNPMIGAVCNGTNSATTVTQPASWTEDFDNGYNVPATGLECCHRDSGNTASTITFGSTTASTFASIAVELDASVPQYDWVMREPFDTGPGIIQSAVGGSNVW